MVTRRRTTERLGKAVASRSADGSVGTAWREGESDAVVMPAWGWVTLERDRPHNGLCLASPEVSFVGGVFLRDRRIRVGGWCDMPAAGCLYIERCRCGD